MSFRTTRGHPVSDQTVGNILRRYGIAPAPERKRTTTWCQFIRSHMAVLAGTDFFTVEVLTWRGLVTYYVLFFLHLGLRPLEIFAFISELSTGSLTVELPRDFHSIPIHASVPGFGLHP